MKSTTNLEKKLMQDKVKTMILFAIRARKFALGESAIDLARGGKIHVALIANDASESSKKKYFDKMRFYKVPVFEYSTKQELGSFLKKDEISLIAIKDINMAKQVIKTIKEGDDYGKKLQEE